MSFTAKLHIQGVGCYAPLYADRNETVPPPYMEAKRLLVVFPDGRPGGGNPRDLCLHLNFVQLLSAHIDKKLEGYTTRFLNRELLTLDTGGAGGDLALDLGHLPKIVEALPDDQAARRPIDPPLLVPGDDDPGRRVRGKLLVEAGSVEGHDDFKADWYFHHKDQKRTYSSVTTVTYRNVDKCELNFRDLGSSNTKPPIPLIPNSQGEVEVWVRNVCDGLPVEETRKHPRPLPSLTTFTLVDNDGGAYEVDLRKIDTDEDFVLNYKVRGSVDSPSTGPVPKFVRLVGGEMHKCMGSV